MDRIKIGWIWQPRTKPTSLKNLFPGSWSPADAYQTTTIDYSPWAIVAYNKAMIRITRLAHPDNGNKQQIARRAYTEDRITEIIRTFERAVPVKYGSITVWEHHDRRYLQ